MQPGGTVALQTFSASTAQHRATSPGAATASDTPGLIANALGNPDLKPERSAECEGGFESSVLNNRVHLDFTYYNKKTHDALISQPIAASSGASALSVLENLGSVSNSGLELTLNTTLLDRRRFGWDITVAASHNSNKILSLGIDPTRQAAADDRHRHDARLGWPAGQRRISRGRSRSPTRTATASSRRTKCTRPATNLRRTPATRTPRDIVSITNGFDLFNRKLRITVLTDYKGGYTSYNSTGQFYATNFATWYSENLKSTPLSDQARNVAESSAKNPTRRSIGLPRERPVLEAARGLGRVDAAATRRATTIRARDAQLVFAARNLHTWTSYTGYRSGVELQHRRRAEPTSRRIAPRTYFILRANLHY